MKTLFNVLLALNLVVSWTGVYLTFSEKAHAADSAACYNVADADARTYCLARSHREPSQCYSIQRADMRSQCLTEVRK